MESQNESIKYLKFLNWSVEDNCFIGFCPGVIGLCCQGDDMVELYRELCKIINEWIEIASKEYEGLPTQFINLNFEEFIGSL